MAGLNTWGCSVCDKHSVGYPTPAHARRAYDRHLKTMTHLVKHDFKAMVDADYRKKRAAK